MNYNVWTMLCDIIWIDYLYLLYIHRFKVIEYIKQIYNLNTNPHVILLI
jgi:hypothetical protein